MQKYLLTNQCTKIERSHLLYHNGIGRFIALKDLEKKMAAVNDPEQLYTLKVANKWSSYLMRLDILQLFSSNSSLDELISGLPTCFTTH